ncbi:major egg antigen [Plakobranchus ocellatus]|uniref:Major egg antigen n=1 Tax=Plakobranchus ocellatus TaxID=259542 RepID=A0AAV4CT11_9GAST|nr:major egg antigen [Plakobranchus ocellatus]
MASPRYISEIHVPIKKDEMSFQDRQIKQWGEVEARMQIHDCFCRQSGSRLRASSYRRKGLTMEHYTTRQNKVRVGLSGPEWACS